jgi:adenylate kinase family enzyme
MRDDATIQHLARVVVVGSSCSGKSTFARELAAVLGSPHVELDALHWGPGWVPKPEPEFVRLTDVATAAPRWVVDGNYRIVREIVWPRATSIVWLNLGFTTVFARALGRTIRRSLTGEELYAGNRESLGRAFLSRESILLWVLQTYGRRRREFRSLMQGAQDLKWFEFRRQSEASAFLHSIRHAA